mgnify:CR=1 FL=1
MIVNIRYATMADLDDIASVESVCFPVLEAATKEEFEQRIKYFGNHFWLMFEGEKLIAFVDGFVTDEADLTDEMYEKAELHNEHGAWQMIFGVNTLPSCRRHGYAEKLLEAAIADARQQGRQGLVLTCKDKLLPYYAKFGFQNEGISASVHGGVTWYQMRLTF